MQISSIGRVQYTITLYHVHCTLYIVHCTLYSGSIRVLKGGNYSTTTAQLQHHYYVHTLNIIASNYIRLSVDYQ